MFKTEKIDIVNADSSSKAAFILTNMNEGPQGSLALAYGYYNNNCTFDKTINQYGQPVDDYGITYPALTFLESLMLHKNLKSVLIYPIAPHSIKQLNSSGDRKGFYVQSLRQFHGILKQFNDIEKVKGIIFSGFYNKFDEEYQSVVNLDVFGRVIDWHGFKAVSTLPINMLFSGIKDSSAENQSSVIGFFEDHIEQLLHGDNFYTLKTENWESILVQDIATFDKMMEEMKSVDYVCFDTETTGLSRTAEKLLTIQIAVSDKKAYVLPYLHKQSPFSADDLKYIAKKFKEFFEFHKNKCHIYHNAKYDILQFFAVFDLKYYCTPIYDTMAGEFALNENRKNLTTFGVDSPYSLKFLSQEYGAPDIFLKGKLGKEDRLTLENAELVDIAEYGVKDVILPYQIFFFQQQEATRKGDMNFYNTVTGVIGTMIYDFVIMEHHGIPVDKHYLVTMYAKSSLFQEESNKIIKELYSLDSVKKANDILLERQNVKNTVGLCNRKPFVFDINKNDSKQCLFFDVLGLTPEKDKKTGGFAIDKHFKDKHADIKEMSLLNNYELVKKAKTSFIDAHLKRFTVDKDLQKDNRLRSTYKFAGVVTGRASSTDPNLQQIPARGPFMKPIRRQFVAYPNKLILKADYSAHEVRNWGNVAGDLNIAKAFNDGKNLRKQLRYYFMNDLEIWQKLDDYKKQIDFDNKNYEERLAELEKIEDKKLKKIVSIIIDLGNKGDVHKMNASLFFNKPPYTVTKQERTFSKKMTFGTIYGMSVNTMAEDLGIEVEKAQEIMDIMFNKFNKGKQWLDRIHNDGKALKSVKSPIGRVRHLDAYNNINSSVIAASNRKGPNSIIQGFSSDIGFMGGKIMQDMCWDFFWSRGIEFDFEWMNAVHDSTETLVRVSHLPIASYLMEHAYTTQVHNKLLKDFNIELVSGFEQDQELGPCYSEIIGFENYCCLEKWVMQSIETGRKEVTDWDVNSDEIEKFKHNLAIISEIRKKEIKDEYGKSVDYEMLLNKDNILEQGLEF